MNVKSLSKEQIEFIRKLHIEELKSIYKISQILDCSPTTIKKILIKNKIQIIDRSITGEKCFKPTIEQEAFIVENYNQFQNKQLLSKKFSVSPKSIEKILKKNHVEIRKTGKYMGKYLSEHDVKNILFEYKNGTSQIIIMKKYKISAKKLVKILKKNVVPIRERQKHKLNKDYFLKIDSKYKAYFLGLIMADGCVYKSRPTDTEVGKFAISLQERDYYLLSKLKEEIEIDKELKFTERDETRQNTYTLSFADGVFCKNLYTLGCTDRKSFTLLFPKIEKQFLSSFILGYFDGDGSISICKKLNKGNMNFISSLFFTKELQNKINEICKTGGNISDRECKNNKQISTLSYCGNLQILRIFNFLYRENDFFLKRKYNKFLELIKISPKKYLTFLISLDPFWKKLEKEIKP